MGKKIEQALSDDWGSADSKLQKKDLVIVSACRTAIGAFGGTLRDSNAALLGSVTMKESVRRAAIDPQILDDVRFGCCLEPADACNVARGGGGVAMACTIETI